MAEGRSKSLWGHTSSAFCLMANIHRNPRSRPYTPDQFNPHSRPRRRHRAVPLSRLLNAIMGPIEGKR